MLKKILIANRGEKVRAAGLSAQPDRVASERAAIEPREPEMFKKILIANRGEKARAAGHSAQPDRVASAASGDRAAGA